MGILAIRFQTTLRRTAVAIVLVATAACTAQFRNHGYVPSQAELTALTPGLDTRDSVAEAIGTPTAGGVLEGQGFYYVASRFRYVGALEPEEIDREIVSLDFDAGGVLRNIERYGLEDGRFVPLNREVTDDNLRDTTFLRQLLSGIGRFDPSAIFGSE